jgi:phage terminase large subunit GpA-like protein
MKFEHLVRIVERFQYEITCPKCGELFQLKNLDILHIKNEVATFQIKCEGCDSVAGISAELGVSKVSTQDAKPKNTSKPHSHINIENLAKSLKSFTKKDDIKKLFDK